MTVQINAPLGGTPGGAQPLDSDLTAIAALTTTAAGLALLDDANAAAQRTTLGLAIGTDVQAYDAELAAIAGLTSAADKGIQFTGAGTAATFDLTTAGKALLDDADAVAQKATLGIPPIVVLTEAVTANVTTTSEPAGTLGKTSNATGLASLFVSDGAKWQYLTNA